MAILNAIYPRIATDESVPLDLSLLPVSTLATPASTGSLPVTFTDANGDTVTGYIPVYGTERT